MLVLTRKPNQSIMIGDEIEISVLAIMGEKVRIGIDAPRSLKVHRAELLAQLEEENQKAASPSEDVVATLARALGDEGD